MAYMKKLFHKYLLNVVLNDYKYNNKYLLFYSFLLMIRFQV